MDRYSSRGLKRDGLSERAEYTCLKSRAPVYSGYQFYFSYQVVNILVKHFLFIIAGEFAALDVGAVGDPGV